MIRFRKITSTQVEDGLEKEEKGTEYLESHFNNPNKDKGQA